MKEILRIVKLKQGIRDDSQDELLILYIEEAITSVLNYCNIFELPDELRFVVAGMVSDVMTEQKSASDASLPVSSVSEQGASVSFDTSLLKLRFEDRVTNIAQLNNFRQLYRAKPR